VGCQQYILTVIFFCYSYIC